MYVCKYPCVHVHVGMHVYMLLKRCVKDMQETCERCVCVCVYVYIYIYIYVCVCVCMVCVCLSLSLSIAFSYVPVL